MFKSYHKNACVLSNIYYFMTVKQHFVRGYSDSVEQYTSKVFLPHSTLCVINNSHDTQSNETSASGLVTRV